MRFGVIADVHANLHALDAALAFLSDQDVDAYLCAGDLVGYGPFPNECVRRVRDLPGRCVAGNHDLIVLDRLSDERCVPLARDEPALDARRARSGRPRLPRRASAGRERGRRCAAPRLGRRPHGVRADRRAGGACRRRPARRSGARPDPGTHASSDGLRERGGWLCADRPARSAFRRRADRAQPGCGGSIARPRCLGPARGPRHDGAGGDLSCESPTTSRPVDAPCATVACRRSPSHVPRSRWDDVAGAGEAASVASRTRPLAAHERVPRSTPGRSSGLTRAARRAALARCRPDAATTYRSRWPATAARRALLAALARSAALSGRPTATNVAPVERRHALGVELIGHLLKAHVVVLHGREPAEQLSAACGASRAGASRCGCATRPARCVARRPRRGDAIR